MEYAPAEAFSGSESPSSPDEDTKPTVNSATLNQAVSEILDLFIEEESMWVVTQIGRELRYGELEELGVLDDIPEEFQVVNAPGLDIFGQPISKTNKANFECECPKCKRTLAAARFAQHLEKCMGMGRNSSRIASRRLAAASTATSSSSSNNAGAEAKSASQGSSSSSTNSQMNGDMGLGTDDEHFSEDDDEDWTMEKKKKTKKGAEKGTPKRKGPVNRLKTSEAGQGKRKVVSPSVSVAASPLSSEVLTGADEDFTLGVLLPPSQ